MMDVTFVLDGVDYSSHLSKYSVVHEVEQRKTITTIDGTEYTATQIRPVIIFSLDPLSDEQSEYGHRYYKGGSITLRQRTVL